MSRSTKKMTFVDFLQHATKNLTDFDSTIDQSDETDFTKRYLHLAIEHYQTALRTLNPSGRRWSNVLALDNLLSQISPNALPFIFIPEPDDTQSIKLHHSQKSAELSVVLLELLQTLKADVEKHKINLLTLQNYARISKSIVNLRSKIENHQAVLETQATYIEGKNNLDRVAVGLNTTAVVPLATLSQWIETVCTTYREIHISLCEPLKDETKRNVRGLRKKFKGYVNQFSLNEDDLIHALQTTPNENVMRLDDEIKDVILNLYAALKKHPNKATVNQIDRLDQYCKKHGIEIPSRYEQIHHHANAVLAIKGPLAHSVGDSQMSQYIARFIRDYMRLVFRLSHAHKNHPANITLTETAKVAIPHMAATLHPQAKKQQHSIVLQSISQCHSALVMAIQQYTLNNTANPDVSTQAITQFMQQFSIHKIPANEYVKPRRSALKSGLSASFRVRQQNRSTAINDQFGQYVLTEINSVFTAITHMQLEFNLANNNPTLQLIDYLSQALLSTGLATSPFSQRHQREQHWQDIKHLLGKTLMRMPIFDLNIDRAEEITLTASRLLQNRQQTNPHTIQDTLIPASPEESTRNRFRLFSLKRHKTHSSSTSTLQSEIR